MSMRFTANLAFLVAGGVVVVGSQSFSPTVTSWLTYAVALGVLVLLGVSQLDPQRSLAQRLLDVPLAGIAIWAAVASRLYTGTTVRWLSFAEALAVVAIALVGLVANELRIERVVHTFGLPSEDRRESGLSTAA